MTQPTNTTLPPYWQPYAAAVADHIRTYTIGQYGDWPHDKCTGYTVEDCLKQIDKYHLRQKKNARPGEDARDLLKIGHYCAMAYTKAAGAIQEAPPAGAAREAEWQAFCAVVAEYMERGPFWAVPKIPTKEITERIRRVRAQDPGFLNLDLFPELALRTAKEWVTLKPATSAPEPGRARDLPLSTRKRLEFIDAMVSARDLDDKLRAETQALEAVGFSINAPIFETLDRTFEFALARIAEQYDIHPDALAWFVFDNKWGREHGSATIQAVDLENTPVVIASIEDFWDFEQSEGGA